MRLEEGKYYRAVNGEKFGPMVERGSYSEPHRWALPVGWERWDSDGRRYDRSCAETDLIAEWTDGPVRTVTRREVVPGVYGRIVVEGVVGDVVVVSLARAAGARGAAMSTGELRAAAAVLLELAGALE